MFQIPDILWYWQDSKMSVYSGQFAKDFFGFNNSNFWHHNKPLFETKIILDPLFPQAYFHFLWLLAFCFMIQNRNLTGITENPEIARTWGLGFFLLIVKESKILGLFAKSLNFHHLYHLRIIPQFGQMILDQSLVTGYREAIFSSQPQRFSTWACK